MGNKFTLSLLSLLNLSCYKLNCQLVSWVFMFSQFFFALFHLYLEKLISHIGALQKTLIANQKFLHFQRVGVRVGSTLTSTRKKSAGILILKKKKKRGWRGRTWGMKLLFLIYFEVTYKSLDFWHLFILCSVPIQNHFLNFLLITSFEENVVSLSPLKMCFGKLIVFLKHVLD